MTRAVTQIAAGRVDKVVLARDLVAVAEQDLDPRWLVGPALRGLRAVLDLPGRRPGGADPRDAGPAGGGPGHLAGAGGHDPADRRRRRATSPSAAALARSSKDLEEHEYAVASVAGALSRYCSAMNVPEQPYVLELPNVLHLATDVTPAVEPRVVLAGPGRRAAPQRCRLRHAHRHRPGPDRGAGAPGPRALRRTGRLDRRRRGRRVGDRPALRQVDETDPRQIRLFAGCGVVAGSDSAAAEYAESVAKLEPMIAALR